MKFSKIITLAINSANAFSWIGISNGQTEMTGQNEDICSSTSLTRGQKRLCQQTPEYSVAIQSAARLSLASCQQELGSACPKAVSKLPKLTGDLKWPSAESGYLHGLSSGQLISASAKLCQMGSIGPCDPIKMAQFVEQFTSIPSMTRRRKMIGQVELHNGRVGRNLADQSSRNLCKCHGQSGSCIFKTCWQTAPIATHLGKLAKEKYIESIGIDHGIENLPTQITQMIAKNDFLFIHKH